MKIKVIDITLGELEGLIERLAEQIESSGFTPNVVVYLETGARLLAFHFHQLTGIAAVPLTIQRSGNATKARIAGLLVLFPKFLQDLLRRIESQLAQQGASKRSIHMAPEINFSDKNVLILDDAADSGQSLLLAKRWVLEKGGVETKLRLATIAVTQPKAREIVDFWIYSQLCRFPWSSDSREREEYLKLYEQVDPERLAASSLRF
jgi:hypoxanthine phosphoribosyltransferase